MRSGGDSKDGSWRIHAAAPIRVCDIGGWTDTWFVGHGKVLNIAVRPFIEVQVTASPRRAEESITLRLENYGETYTLGPGKISYERHPLIEATIDGMELPPDLALEVAIFSSAPSGASVGTSAAVSVALIGALDALTPGLLTPHEVAALAHHVETEKLGLQSGIQDQLCAAYGGISYIQMHAYPHSSVSPVSITEKVRWDLEARLALIYIGTPHNSSEVHKKVIADLGGDAGADPRIEGLRRLAHEAKNAVGCGDLAALGDIMNRNTALQRELHADLVCDRFEEIIEVAESFGAVGCKVNGAGGDGGSITILGDSDAVKKRRLVADLERRGYHAIPVHLAARGLRVWEERMQPQ